MTKQTKTEAPVEEAKTTAVAEVKQNQAVAVVSDDTDELFAHAGAGLSNAGANDYAIPFLVVLQPLSPQVSKQNPEYVQGAEAGMIYNSVTKKLYTELGLIPCEFRKVFVEWVTREGGGSKSAPVGEHDINSGIEKTCTRDDRKRLRMPGTGNTLVETAYHYVLAVDQETGESFQAVLSLDSTDLTPSRNWLTVMASQEMTHPTTGAVAIVPTFAQLYVATSKFRTNDAGQWFNWVFNFKSLLFSKDNTPVEPELLHLRKKAMAFSKLVKEGMVKVDRNSQTTAEEVVSAPAEKSAAY